MFVTREFDFRELGLLMFCFYTVDESQHSSTPVPTATSQESLELDLLLKELDQLRNERSHMEQLQGENETLKQFVREFQRSFSLIVEQEKKEARKQFEAG